MGWEDGVVAALFPCSARSSSTVRHRGTSTVRRAQLFPTPILTLKELKALFSRTETLTQSWLGLNYSNRAERWSRTPLWQRGGAAPDHPVRGAEPRSPPGIRRGKRSRVAEPSSSCFYANDAEAFLISAGK